jgi:hypothetical protein
VTSPGGVVERDLPTLKMKVAATLEKLRGKKVDEE